MCSGTADHGQRGFQFVRAERPEAGDQHVLAGRGGSGKDKGCTGAWHASAEFALQRICAIAGAVDSHGGEGDDCGGNGFAEEVMARIRKVGTGDNGGD